VRTQEARTLEQLTDRDRFLRIMSYQAVDRVPYWEMTLWGQTLDRWLSEGMPTIETDLLGPFGLRAGCRFFGLDRKDFADVRLEALPPFPETIMEETDRYRVFIDVEGSTRRALRAGESHGTRTSMDTFIDFPAKTREEWAAFKKRFDPSTPARYPKWWEEKVRVWSGRDYPLLLPANSEHNFGLYSFLRRCMGTVNACLVFYDDPAFAEELLDFYTDFTIETIHKALHDVQLDCFNIFEDMAGKGGPLVSPHLMRRFMVPRYRRLTDFLRSHGLQFISMDSDGDMRPLISLLLESGINCLWPLEPASGMDPIALRKEYGRDLRLWGGIDKRELAKGPKEIEQELLAKIPPMLEQGGCIPMLDHDVPPDVSYSNFLYYLDLRRRICEGRYGA
jgi:hypothetical protein